MASNNRSSLVVGALLILAGLLFLVDQVFHIQIASFTWPLLVMGLGGAFFIGMLVGGKSMGGLAIPGTIITGIGAILLVQNTFNLWETWSYTWSLIICFVGIGMMIYGTWSEIPEVRASGFRTLRIGTILFLVFGGIFGVLFSMTNAYGLKSSLVWAVVLILFGFYLLITRIINLFRPIEEGQFRHRENLFWPVVFIGGGALWMLVAINVLPLTQALALLNLWPLLLIVGGIDLMLGRRFPVVNLALGVLIVGALFFFAFAGPAFGLTRLNWYNAGWINIGSGLPLQHINGSGKTAIEGRELTGFDRVKFSTVGEAEIVQGENEGIVIEAEDNLLPYITTGVFAGEMVIDVKPGVGINPTKTIHYKITMKNLKEVRTSGAVKVTIRPMSVDKLSVSSSGVGEIELVDLKANSLKGDISGAGSITASGTSPSVDFNISGTGSIAAYNLKATSASVNISGMGSAQLWVTDTLNTHISGAGSVSYYGSPKVSQDNSGLGSAKSMGAK